MIYKDGEDVNVIMWEKQNKENLKYLVSPLYPTDEELKNTKLENPGYICYKSFGKIIMIEIPDYEKR